MQSRSKLRRAAVRLAICAGVALLLWPFLFFLEDILLTEGILNTKDMTFVGNETGTLREYALNVWHWDATVILLPVGCFLLLLLSGFLLLAELANRPHEPGRCRKCRYDLTGNVSGVCPERGSEV